MEEKKFTVLSETIFLNGNEFVKFKKNQLARRCSLGVLESQNHNIKKKSGMNSLFLSSVPFYFIYFILFLTPFALSFCSSF